MRHVGFSEKLLNGQLSMVQFLSIAPYVYVLGTWDRSKVSLHLTAHIVFSCMGFRDVAKPYLPLPSPKSVVLTSLASRAQSY